MNKEKIFLSSIDPQGQVLAREKGLGLEIAEFCTAWNLDRELPETDRTVREKIRGISRVTLHGPFNELFPCAVDPKARELAAFRFRQALDAAQRYGAQKVILHGGYNPYLYYPCWFREQSRSFWQDFLPDIPDGMTVCVENVLEKEPEWLADFIREIGSPKLRMCLDVGHAHAYSSFSAFQWTEECADVIGHFHLHNNDGTGDTHSPLFEGTISMEELIHQIDKLCPLATATLELPDGAASLRWMEERGLMEEETWI